ncbi:MAG: tetratricopeptide repeat protein [Calothrix sp. MO_167.B12]|nr:tetratricopeptide repeat protein [Calothrix sp. MO_167.B12]
MLKQLLQWLQRFFKWLSGGKWISSRHVTEKKLLAPPPELSNSDLEFLFTQLLEGVYQARGQEWALKYLQRMEDRIDDQRWLEWLSSFGDRLLASPAPNSELASRLVDLGELDIGEISELAYEIGIQLMTRNLGDEFVDFQMAGDDIPEDSPQQVWEYQAPNYFSEYETEAENQLEPGWEGQVVNNQGEFATDSQFLEPIQPRSYQDNTDISSTPPDLPLPEPVAETEAQVPSNSQFTTIPQPWQYQEDILETPPLPAPVEDEEIAETEAQVPNNSQFTTIPQPWQYQEDILETPPLPAPVEDEEIAATEAQVPSNSQFTTIPQPWQYQEDILETPPLPAQVEDEEIADSQIREPIQSTSYAADTKENISTPPTTEIWGEQAADFPVTTPTSESVVEQTEEIEISPTTPLNSHHENHGIQVRQTPAEPATTTWGENLPGNLSQEPVAHTLDELLVRLQQSASLVQQLSSGLHNQPVETLEAGGQQTSQSVEESAQSWFFQGLQQAKQGNLSAALSSYERAIALKPQAYEYWFNTGLTLFHLGNYESALSAYQRAIALKPDFSKGWYNQGITLAALSRLEEAMAAFDQAIAIKPDYQEAWADRGWVLRKLKQYQSAIASYDQALQIQPQNPESLCHQGMVLAAAGETQAAIKNYGQALQLLPTYEEAWYKLGDALVQLGRSEDAIPYYERAMELNQNHYQAWCGRAMAWYNLGRYNDALVSCETALEINPKYGLGWYQRGIILSGLGRQEEAIASYDWAIEITPQLDSAWLQRGISLYQLGQWSEAITSFDRAIAIAPQNHEAWYFKGTALDKLSRWQEAIAAYQRASEIKPDFHDVWIDQGVALIQLGNLEAAIAAWDKALELKPDFYLAWYNRGVALDNLQRYPEAVSSYDQAVYFQPDFDLAWYNRGVALFYLGQLEEAIASYDRALAIKPDYWEAWISRANAVEKSSYCDPHLSFESDIAHRNPALNQRGYYGKVATYEEGLQHIHQDTHPEPWGRFHLAIGNALYSQGRRDGAYRDYWMQAVAEYDLALSTLTMQDFPQLHLEVLQSQIIALLGLGQISQAKELHEQGMNVWGYLLGDTQFTEADKKQLSLKVAGLGQLAVDLSIQSGEFVSALEIAEQGKNACLTWQLYGWNEEIYSPTYKSIQQLLSSTTAIVYWHISPYGMHTFVLKQNYPEPIHIFTPMVNPGVNNQFPLPEVVQRLVDLEDWVQDWDWQYQEYRQTARDKQSKVTHSWRLLMEQRLEYLREILNIANIEEELQNINQLILVPHQDLHRFPLHELFHGNYVITYLPSTQIGLLGQSTAFNINRQQSLLSVEYPNSNGYLPLRFTKLQTEAVNQMFANCTSIVTGKATKNQLENALENHHQILHFNGYGINNFTNSDESALLLTGDEKLTLVDICNHSLASYKLVCLAANETLVSGNNQTLNIEYVGLASGFLSQGVNYVLAPLWTVESAASTLVIVEFYRNLQQGKLPTQALATATRWLREVTAGELVRWYEDLLSDLGKEELSQKADLATELYRIKQMSADEQLYTHPYYWAGFTIVGNSE